MPPVVWADSLRHQSLSGCELSCIRTAGSCSRSSFLSLRRVSVHTVLVPKPLSDILNAAVSFVRVRCATATGRVLPRPRHLLLAVGRRRLHHNGAFASVVWLFHALLPPGLLALRCLGVFSVCCWCVEWCCCASVPRPLSAVLCLLTQWGRLIGAQQLT